MGILSGLTTSTEHPSKPGVLMGAAGDSDPT